MMKNESNEIVKFLKTRELLDKSFEQYNIISTGKIQEYPKSTISDYLVAFSTQTHNYCVGCVDMVNSTKISASIPPKKLTSYYEIFLNSMSKIISKFGGCVIKNVGDCLLYYFPESKDVKNSEELVDCIDCGLSMIKAQPSINQMLLENNLPRLHYRVSEDFGAVLIMNTTDSQKVDLIGPPVNMCTKINRCAEKDGFVIGADLQRIVRKIQKYKFKQTKGFNAGFIQTYPVYSLTYRSNY